MMTEDKKEIFDNDTIVEFRFDKMQNHIGNGFLYV